jgi:hypothetical protein
VVPGNQMYLPMIGLDLREYFLAANAVPKADLSPAAQLIAVLLLDREAHSLAALGDLRPRRDYFANPSTNITHIAA